MNKTSKLLLGLAALTFAACSNDEPSPEGPVQATGDRAYLYVNISSTDDSGYAAAPGSRAENSYEDWIYIDGDKDENDVISADFYFYDDQGKYVLKANVWTGGNTEGTTNNTIEYIGNNVVVLEGLTGKNYPTWVVTVLNKPADFLPGSTLDEMGKLLFENIYNSEGKLVRPAYLNETGKFIMSTSSKFSDSNKDGDGWRYFATKLNTNNFYQQTPEQVDFVQKDRVQIYVERLAARVGVDVQIGSGTQEIKKIGDRLLYRVDASVSGNPNEDISGGGNTGVGATKLYVEITGWDLTTTAKATKVMKDLSDWTDKTTFGGTDWAWNRGNDRYRSFWGKATTYGKSGAALEYLLDTQTTWESLKYKPTDKIFTGDRAYCNENTNLPENITDNGLVTGKIDPSKTTSVILQAVVCDENGDPVNLVNFQGVNYEQTAFLNKALTNTVPLYTREEAGKTEFTNEPYYNYTAVTAKDLKLVSAGDGTGTVKVEVANDELEYFSIADENAYTETKVNIYDEEGNLIATETKKVYEAEKVNPNSLFLNFTSGNKAIAYKDGASFYPIAIEHLNKPTEDTEGIIEAQYGVVRNHIYNIRITKIKTLGHGVFVPKDLEDGTKAEPISPETKDPTYYVESNINILSWKVVSQEAEI